MRRNLPERVRQFCRRWKVGPFPRNVRKADAPRARPSLGNGGAASRSALADAACAALLLAALALPGAAGAEPRFADGVIYAMARIVPADTPAALPEAWCRAWFGTPTVDPEADPDADGLTNAEEYGQGTDPTEYDTDGDGMGDGNELRYRHDPLVPHEPPLAFASIETQTNGAVRLRWRTMFGLGYRPQFADDLAIPAWSNLVPQILWEGTSWPSGELSVLDPDAPLHPARFYRILSVDDEDADPGAGESAP